ncbi:MAG: S1 family peptidase [Kofleriaceae bacterium]
MIGFLLSQLVSSATGTTVDLEHHETPIIQGSSATETDAAVVALHYSTANVPLCTGVLVASSVILTAAHCIAPVAGPLNAPSSIELDGGARVPTTWVEVHPDFERHDLEADLALVGLAWPVDVAPMPLVEHVDASWIGRSLRWVGYGASEPGGLAGLGTKRFANVPVASVGDTKLTSVAASCNGDSGGAVVDESTSTLVGIISSGTGGCNAFSRATRVDAHAAWIRARIDAGGATCEQDGRCALACANDDLDCSCVADGVCAPCAGVDADCRHVGDECDRDEQCSTGASCGLGVCRSRCASSIAACTDEEVCDGPAERRLCWPTAVGCQAAPASMLPMSLVLIFGAGWRRRASNKRRVR